MADLADYMAARRPQVAALRHAPAMSTQGREITSETAPPFDDKLTPLLEGQPPGWYWWDPTKPEDGVHGPFVEADGTRASSEAIEAGGYFQVVYLDADGRTSMRSVLMDGFRLNRGELEVLTGSCRRVGETTERWLDRAVRSLVAERDAAREALSKGVAQALGRERVINIQNVAVDSESVRRALEQMRRWPTVLEPEQPLYSTRQAMIEAGLPVDEHGRGLAVADALRMLAKQRDDAVAEADKLRREAEDREASEWERGTWDGVES